MEEDCDSPEICPQIVFRDRQFDPRRRRQMEKAKTRKVCGLLWKLFWTTNSSKTEFVCDLETPFTKGKYLITGSRELLT